VIGRVRNAAILSPEALTPTNLGDVVLTQVVDRTFTVTNTGELESGTLVMAGAPDDGFQVIDEAGSCIAGGGVNLQVAGTCTIHVRFTSAIPLGAKDATITLDGPNVTGPAVAIAIMQANSVEAALIGATPSTTRAFGSVGLGDLSAAEVITLNNGTQPDTLATGQLTIGVTGSNAEDYELSGACTTLGATGIVGGGTCALSVVFQPKSVHASSMAMLTVSAPNGGSVSVPLTGTGIPSISIAPGGTQTFAGAGSQVTFTVSLVSPTNPTATGPLTVTVSSPAFQESMQTCRNTSLVGTGLTTCTIQLTFTGSVATTASLQVSGTAPNNVTTAVTLSGTP
jgi:hypothetical protein